MAENDPGQTRNETHIRCIILQFDDSQGRLERSFRPLAKDLRIDSSTEAGMSAHPPIIGVADVMDDQHKTVEVVGELPRIRQECCHTCAVLVAPPEHLS